MACADGSYCGNTSWQDCSSGCSGSCSANCGYGCGGTCLAYCAETCNGNCTGDCRYSCSGSCDGSCRYGCSGSCDRYCADSCNGGCSGTCEDTCKNTCTDNCNNGCSGGEYTSVYLNLAFSTLIKAKEILDLKNMSINEASRRNKTTVDTVNEVTNSEILAKTMQDIKSNLTNAGTSSSLATVSQNSTIYKNIAEAYLNAAKTLYQVKIPAS